MCGHRGRGQRENRQGWWDAAPTSGVLPMTLRRRFVPPTGRPAIGPYHGRRERRKRGKNRGWEKRKRGARGRGGIGDARVLGAGARRETNRVGEKRPRQAGSSPPEASRSAGRRATRTLPLPVGIQARDGTPRGAKVVGAVRVPGGGKRGGWRRGRGRGGWRRWRPGGRRGGGGRQGNRGGRRGRRWRRRGWGRRGRRGG